MQKQVQIYKQLPPLQNKRLEFLKVLFWDLGCFMMDLPQYATVDNLIQYVDDTKVHTYKIVCSLSTTRLVLKQSTENVEKIKCIGSTTYFHNKRQGDICTENFCIEN